MVSKNEKHVTGNRGWLPRRSSTFELVPLLLPSSSLPTATTSTQDDMSFLHLPLLVFLHFLTLIYSILPSNPFKSWSSPSPSSTSSKPSRPPPRHVALLLVPPSRRPNLSSAASTASIESEDEDVKEALMESVLRAVRWAEEEGVQELTVFEGGNHGQFTVGSRSLIVPVAERYNFACSGCRGMFVLLLERGRTEGSDSSELRSARAQLLLLPSVPFPFLS